MRCCFSVKVGRADYAGAAVKHDKAPLPIVASLAPLGNASGDSDVNADTLIVLSKSWLTVLDESHIFKNVYTSAEAPDAVDLLDKHPGQLDEDELKISYKVIDDYLEGKDVPEEVAQLIEQPYRATEHKRHGPDTL